MQYLLILPKLTRLEVIFCCLRLWYKTFPRALCVLFLNIFNNINIQAAKQHEIKRRQD